MNDLKTWFSLTAWSGDKSRAAVSLCLAALLLGGCVSTIDVENSNFYRPPNGTVIELKTDLNVVAHSNQAYVQGGKVVASRGELRRYSPWCEFRVARSNDEMNSGWVIERERFVVTSSHRGVDYAAFQRAQASILFAGRDRILWPSHPEVSMENMATIMNIRSSEQPAVRQMVCMIFSDALYANHLSLREIRETLGMVAAIVLPVQP